MTLLKPLTSSLWRPCRYRLSSTDISMTYCSHWPPSVTPIQPLSSLWHYQSPWNHLVAVCGYHRHHFYDFIAATDIPYETSLQPQTPFLWRHDICRHHFCKVTAAHFCKVTAATHTPSRNVTAVTDSISLTSLLLQISSLLRHCHYGYHLIDVTAATDTISVTSLHIPALYVPSLHITSMWLPLQIPSLWRHCRYI
jgi:hypothetical protein